MCLKFRFAIVIFLIACFGLMPSSALGQAPTISGIAPSSGPVSTQVVITGTNFGTTKGTVSLNGTSATIVTWAATSIRVIVPAGATSGSFTVTANGQNVSSSVFTVTKIPANWTNADVGAVGLAGIPSFASDVFTIQAAGNDLMGTADALNYTYLSLNGDGTVVARILSQNGSWSSKAGIMIRESLNAGSTYAFLTNQALSNPTLYFYSRATTGGSVSSSSTSLQLTALPYWVKLNRTGNVFTPYTSSDGVNWVQLGASQTISMAQSVYIGLAFANNNTSALGTATFDNVAVSSSTSVRPVISKLSATTGNVGAQITITGTGFGTTQGSSVALLSGVPMPIVSWSSTSVKVSIPTGGTSGPLTISLGPQMNDSNPVRVLVTTTPLPSPWLDQDVGSVAVSGSSGYTNGVFTVAGAGQGYNASAYSSDGFHFVYQQVSGDITIVARVVTNPANYAEAGIMIRQGLDSGSINESESFQTISYPGNMVSLADRLTSGANASMGNYLQYTNLPYWLKLTKSGTTITGFTSTDGENWSQLGSNTLNVTGNFYIGLAVSNDFNSTTLASATFDNVSTSTAASPAPVITGVSATTGAIGSQITITGSGFGTSQGSSRVYINGKAATVNTWATGSVKITIPTGTTSGPLTVAVAPSMNNSNPIGFTVTANPLPQMWLDQDVGTVGASGCASYSNGVYTISGAGAGMGASAYAADGFHFVYQLISGDVTIVARVLTNPSNYAEAAVMIRQTLDASSANENVMYQTINYPSNISTLNTRTNSGANTNSPIPVSYINLPYWLKLVRAGSTFSGFVSTDGVNWSQLSTYNSVSLGSSVYVGLGVSGYSVGTLATATFDSVSISTPTVPAPVITNVSATTGAVGSTVTITGSGFGGTRGSSNVLLNGVPVTINTWASGSIGITIPTGATSGPLLVTVAPSMIDSNPVNFTVTSQGLPSPWLDQDVGSVGLAGSATYSAGTFTVKGAGSGVGGYADSFHFVYQALPTNGTLVARVASVQSSPYLTQVGIMIRESVDAYSDYIFPFYLTGPQTLAMAYRVLTAGSGNQTSSSGAVLPLWLKVDRTVNTFTSYTSLDGIHWNPIGTTQTFPTAQTVYVGLAVSSESTTNLATATFDNVSVTPGTTLPNPVITSLSPSIGAPGAIVTINGSGFGTSQSTSIVSFNGMPASINSWTSDSQIAAIAPFGATTGPVSVVVGNITATGPAFSVMFKSQVTDSLTNQTNYTSQVFGGKWWVTGSQGSGCSSCSLRGNYTSQYDSKGNLLLSIDPMGNNTRVDYDGSNNPVAETKQLDPNTPVKTTYTYNSLGQVLTMTDALNHVTTNSYDSKGNLLTVTTPSPDGSGPASVTQFAYNTLGQMIQITDPLNNITTIAYNPVGLIYTITDAQNNVTTYGYDLHGNRTSVTDALHNQTTFTYDTGDRLTKITYPDSSTTQFGYDTRGRRTSVTDQNSKQTIYSYDDADRLISVKDANNQLTQYGYDTESNLITITDANNHLTKFDYDNFGRVKQTTFPSTLTETYTYDANNNLQTKKDRNGNTITYVYDALNRLSKKQYPNSTEIDYIYDLVGKLQQVSDPTGTYAFAYDNMGRLIGTTTNYAFLPGRNFTASYGYDKASNRTSFTDPENGLTNYTYDTLNRLYNLTDAQNHPFTFGYDALSRRTQLTRANGVNTAYAYDNLSRLQSVLHQLGGSTIDGASYGLDAAGNRTSKTDQLALVTTNYGYDAIYQLQSGTQGSTTEGYTYDPVGNRLNVLGGATWSYNSSNQLTARPSHSYTYDNNGNLKTDVTGGNTTTYNWDYENRLTSAVLPGSGGTVTFKYDPFGRRIYKSSSSGTSIYSYDGNSLAEETDAAGISVARYAQGPNIDEPLAMLRSSATSYYEADGLGSITSLTNAAGAITNNYTYDSFGNLVATSGSIVNSFRYTGREFDMETGLYYYRNRYYDPVAGRFLSEDPIGFLGGVDFYKYVFNAPTMWRDPQGLAPWGPPAVMVPSSVPELARRGLQKLHGDLGPLCRKGRNMAQDYANLSESIATRVAEIEWYMNHEDANIQALADPDGTHADRIAAEEETRERCKDMDPKCDPEPKPYFFPVPEFKPDAKRVPAGATSTGVGGVIVIIVIGLGLLLAL